MNFYRTLQVCVESAEIYPQQDFMGVLYLKVGAFSVPTEFTSTNEVDDTPTDAIITTQELDIDGVTPILNVWLIASFAENPDQRASLLGESNNGDTLHLTIVTYSQFVCREVKYKDIWAMDLSINMKSDTILTNEDAIAQGVIDMVCTRNGERWMRQEYGITSLGASIFKNFSALSDSSPIIDEIDARVRDFFTSCFLNKRLSSIEFDVESHKVGVHLNLVIGGFIRKQIIIRETFLI